MTEKKKQRRLKVAEQPVETPAAPENVVVEKTPLEKLLEDNLSALQQARLELPVRSGMVRGAEIIADRVFQDAMGTEEEFAKNFSAVMEKDQDASEQTVAMTLVQHYMTRARSIVAGVRQGWYDDMKRVEGRVASLEQQVTQLQDAVK